MNLSLRMRVERLERTPLYTLVTAHVITHDPDTNEPLAVEARGSIRLHVKGQCDELEQDDILTVEVDRS